jgi:hypothetical protein
MMKSFFLEKRVFLLTWTAGVLLLLQVMNLHSYVASAVDHQAVVAATDDDASWNIAKTVQTRWWKDNGWALYGPFYFRVNHSIQYFWERTANPAEVGPTEAWERTAHHSILTVSLLSVCGLSLLIAAALFEAWWTRFLFAIAMNAAFLSNPQRAEFLLRAHPDHLFALVMAGAFFLTALMFFRPGEAIWRKLSASLWGVSVAVKMTTALCAPGFLLLFVPPFRRKENWLNGLRYLGVMFLGYFLVGFPQTIVLGRPIRDLAIQGGLSTPATWDSVTHRLDVYWAQFWGPALVILLAVLILGPRRSWPALGRAWWRLAAFATLPFLILLRNKILVPSDHYTIPFEAMLILLLAFAATKMKWSLGAGREWLRAGAFFAAAMAIWGSTPQALQTALVKNLNCRDQAREAYTEILKLYDAGEKIWVDPYVPYFFAGEKSRIDLSWDKTWKDWDSTGWTVNAMSAQYRDRYITGDEPDAYSQKEHPNWRDLREFYSAFKDGDTAKSPSGKTFKRIYKNTCGQEIWRQQR